MIAYVDMFSGISGDMMLGAWMDLGVDPDRLEKDLSGLLRGFCLKSVPVYRHHLKATDLTVDVNPSETLSRNYKDIRALIRNSRLPEEVRRNSLSAFEKIARAESGIHGHDLEEVHFHEVGGVDAVVDIVGSFLCAHYLGVTKVYASPVPLGSGRVECSHGVLPVPVPAVLEILKDIPVQASDARTEIVTPTGAAIIATLASSFGPMPAMHIRKTGYGAGKRATGSALPNLIRIVLGEPDHCGTESDGSESRDFIRQETIQVIRTNVDDMSPETAGFLMDTLLAGHALDVAFIPVQMKKNRPGLQIEVLCRKNHLQSLVRLLLSETTTIGVRVSEWDRYFLSREIITQSTSLGEIQIKKITNPDGSARKVPEYESVRKAAEDHNLAFQTAYTRILSDINMLDTE